MQIHPKGYPFLWFIFIPVVIWGIILLATRLIPQQRSINEHIMPSFSGSLRGYTLMLITFPHQHDFKEYISISERQTAFRSRIIDQQPLLKYTERQLSDALWQSLQQLYQSWCAKPPPMPADSDIGQLYNIAVDCHRATNPIVYLTAEQLPPAIRTLLDTVPPPPEPR